MQRTLFRATLGTWNLKPAATACKKGTKKDASVEDWTLLGQCCTNLHAEKHHGKHDHHTYHEEERNNKAEHGAGR
jgi:hypothetical protein